MTIDTRNQCVRAGQRETREIVIQCGGLPCRRVVALRALGRKPVRNVVRIIRTCVILLVAGKAGCWRSGETGHVATVAGDFYMRTGEREVREIVIPIGGFPRRGRVTPCAVCRKL